MKNNTQKLEANTHQQNNRQDQQTARRSTSVASAVNETVNEPEQMDNGRKAHFYDELENHIDCNGDATTLTPRDKYLLLKIIKLKEILTQQEAQVYTGLTQEYLREAGRCGSLRSYVVLADDQAEMHIATRYRKSDLDAFMLENCAFK